MEHDYYEILGVPEDADLATIKSAYFELAEKHHPERGGEHDEMVLIGEAWAILSDPEVRQRYDEALAQGGDPKRELSTRIAADTRRAREKAKQYPKEWSAFESWWVRVCKDFTNTSYGATRSGARTTSPSFIPNPEYVMTMPIKVVMFVVLLITLAVWSVIGFIFWIPMLIRATTVFSALVAHAAFTRQDPHNARHALEAASGFYFRGFRTAIDVIYNPPVDAQPIQLQLGLILIEVCWTILFWFLLLWVLSPATVAPFTDWVSKGFQSFVNSVGDHS